MSDSPDSAMPGDEDDGATRVISQGQAVAALSPGAQKAAAASHQNGVLAMGTRLGEFEIRALIGQGGFGAVYEAWDHVLERPVAIKEYLPSSLSARQSDGSVAPLSERHRETFDLGMRSFINEARLLAQFDHPSLLKVYRFWEDRGTTYLVMPLYRGRTLRQVLSQMAGNVREDWLLQMADAVTRALSVMHGANCFHRDIAPDNILLLDEDGRPVVLDFGAARRVITDKTQAITVILKPGYAPVEQYAEMPDMKQGAWTDVYALAAVLHVAVCGRPPPPSVARVMSDGYLPLAHNGQLRERFSLQLLEAIDNGLAVRPEHRPHSMGEFRALLGLEGSAGSTQPLISEAASFAQPRSLRQPVPDAEPPSAPPAPLPTEFRNAPRHLPESLWIVGGLGILLLAAGAAWLVLKPDPQMADADPGPVSVASGTDSPLPSPASAPVSPPAPPVEARTPLQSLQALGDQASAAFGVQATALKPLVRIGKDALEFELKSQRDGFVYVYLLSSGGELMLLFPNQLDRHNRVRPSETLKLPRPAWPMTAGGPRGVNQFAVIVSAVERDFSETGAQSDGVFSQIPLNVLAALETANSSNTGAASPLLGKAVCPSGGQCGNEYGVAFFSVTEE
ncbi:serine/threonine-protein kinase [Diaphorobacter aerolatus]|uniref:non-specific serine/threonine protein kinase n=1 Tax=Diaphorobacter aerolatus TaxID=1288495 RepID=A0A7H0GLK2_9BURK|nr:serine/threonine-protein kinase [Diaphorobacter aerolatus]QNP49168.1 protein kinase [Diaphorobacter aerolatus]